MKADGFIYLAEISFTINLVFKRDITGTYHY